MKLYTGGTFDIFHYGHMHFLKNCKKIADQVVVALNTDEFIFDYKGKKPIMSYRERELSIIMSGLADQVVPNYGGKDSKPEIKMVSPDIIAVGDDWAAKDYYKQMDFTEDWLEENGILLVYLPYTKSISTTELKNRIKNAQ